MQEKAKERVFGVVILVALSVIFIPMWFNTTVGDSAKLDRDIPSAPAWPQSEELLLPSERLLPTAQSDSAPLVAVAAVPVLQEESAPPNTALVSVPELVAPVPMATTPVAVVAAQEPAVAPTVVSVAPVQKPVAKTAAVSVKKTVATAKVAQKTAISKTKTTLANTATTKASGKPLMAYTVQLGNFENQANAQKLARSLRAAGYTAYVSDNYVQGKDLKKVMVGPHADRRDAEKVASKLEGQYKLKGFIVKYDPRD